MLFSQSIAASLAILLGSTFFTSVSAHGRSAEYLMQRKRAEMDRRSQSALASYQYTASQVSSYSKGIVSNCYQLKSSKTSERENYCNTIIEQLSNCGVVISNCGGGTWPPTPVHSRTPHSGWWKRSTDAAEDISDAYASILAEVHAATDAINNVHTYVPTSQKETIEGLISDLDDELSLLAEGADNQVQGATQLIKSKVAQLNVNSTLLTSTMKFFRSQ